MKFSISIPETIQTIKKEFCELSLNLISSDLLQLQVKLLCAGNASCVQCYLRCLSGLKLPNFPGSVLLLISSFKEAVEMYTCATEKRQLDKEQSKCMVRKDLRIWCRHGLFSTPRDIVKPNRNKWPINSPPIQTFQVHERPPITMLSNFFQLLSTQVTDIMLAGRITTVT